MFAYLSKKIAIPNNVRLNCISWNQKPGYIAVGGEDGLLKVLRVDGNDSATTTTTKTRNIGSSGNLSMNQTLEGHNGHVQVVIWNEEYQKLTSSDQNGVIVVWMLYKGSWYEEMINNRNKSTVKGMSWSFDGQKICIVYEDGAVIVGSVDGNRIWGKELKNTTLTAVQWSPDGKLLLFGLKNGTIQLYDNQGLFLMNINVNISTNLFHNIVSMHWYNGKNGYIANDIPTLAICYENGRIQLMKDTNDDDPIGIETGITNVWCSWNTYGSLLAVTGIQSIIASGEAKDTNILQFYTPFGKLTRTLKIPGREVTGCSWEGNSLRVALSVDSHIYFANIRPAYKWTYFSNTIVFTNERITKDGICITFWNTSNNTCCTKNVRELIDICSQDDHCTLAVKNDPSQSNEPYSLIVCNAIAIPIDTKFIDFESHWITMTSNTIISASKNNFIIWKFRTPRSASLNINSRLRKDKLYHIDDTPTGVTEVIQDLDRDGSFETPINTKATTDPICCLASSENFLLIGRESGMIQRYTLPQITLTNRYTTSSRPQKISINCNSTRASIIDISGRLTMLDLEPSKSNDNNDHEDVSKFEKKEVWAMCWAQDNPSLLAIMEKTRMYVIRGIDPEEPLSCSGYICCFKDLEIRCILLDELVQKPDDTRADLIIDLEVKSLRDTKDLLTKVGLKEAHDFIQDNPHPRLWRLLAESALKSKDLEMAENAMVRCTDYLGIQFIKRLHTVHNDQLKTAEISAFLGNYDEAEKLYLDLDRRDLAIKLRQKLGDYFRVLKLMKIGIGGTDKQLEHAYNKIGDYHAERQNWEGAKEYYEKGRNLDELIECYYKLEDYEQLAKIVEQLPDKSSILKKVARMLASVGMCPQAVSAYIKYGDVKQAVDTCVRLNHWDQAVDLAKTYKMAEINDLLNKYANHLLSNDKILQAIELYKSANCYLEASKLVLKLAEEQAKLRINPLRIKKLYVLAALLIEDYINRTPVAKGGRSNVVMGLIESNEDARVIDNAWRGAEAYHYLLLAHRQIYNGDFDSAMKTSLRLREYEDIIDTEDIYCLLALSSANNRSFSTCSKAFIKLEALTKITDLKKNEYEELALDIFLKHSPIDVKNNKSECVNCESLVPDWCIACPNCITRFPACVVTGKPLMDLTSCWICTVCRHHAATERDIVNIHACPLCHTTITYM